MSTTRSGRRSGAPAASLLVTRPADSPKIIDRAASEDPSPSAEVVGAPPVGQVSLEEHKAKQQEYREWLRKMAAQTPAEAAAQAEPEAEAQGEPIRLPTPQERAERAQQEDLGAYLTACIEMSADEPRYYVGLRPPRPKWGRMLLEIGDLVPGAARWPRLDSWTRQGIVIPEAQMKRAG